LNFLNFVFVGLPSEVDDLCALLPGHVGDPAFGGHPHGAPQGRAVPYYRLSPRLFDQSDHPADNLWMSANLFFRSGAYQQIGFEKRAIALFHVAVDSPKFFDRFFHRLADPVAVIVPASQERDARVGPGLFRRFAHESILSRIRENVYNIVRTDLYLRNRRQSAGRRIHEYPRIAGARHNKNPRQ
jgi:hypothetical protein